jgi:cyclophilin family peptidyl-prolyl cis-trans isomerase
MTWRSTAAVLAMLVLAACATDPSPSSAVACPTEAPTENGAQAILDGVTQATIAMDGAVSGEIVIELRPDDAPISTANFVALARCGFYDGQWWHRVLAGFVIQAGDPGTRREDGDFPELGRGGPGYEFAIEPPGEGLDYEPYTVAMANDTAAQGSQFFITLGDLRGRLPLQYTIFGRVTEGTDVVDAIAALPVNDPQIGVPFEIARIASVRVEGGPDHEADGG